MVTAPVAAPKGLGAVAAKGVFWTGGGQILRQLVQLATSVVLARLLVPDDFGMLGMALVVVGIGQIFADFGIGAAIVQSQTSDRRVLSSCFWANLAVGATLALVISLASPWIAAFYRRPDLAPLVVVASLTLVASAAIVVPRSSLYRDMRFAELAKAQFFGSVAGALLAIGLAWAGFGVWALVLQPLAGTSVTLALSWFYARLLPRWEFSWDGIRGLVRFSAGVLGTDLLNFANRNTDSLLIGRALGAQPLGYYSMSYQIMLYPLQQVSSAIVKVLFPTLSQMQNDLQRLRAAYLKSISFIAIVTFPMMSGLFVVAEDLIRVAMGEKWLPILPVLQILVWVGMAQSIGTTVGTIYLSTANVRRMFQLTLLGTAMLVSGVAIGLNWGIEGVAAGYAIGSLSFMCVSLSVALRIIGLRMRHLLISIIRPFAAAISMLVILMGTTAAMGEVRADLRLLLTIASGITLYVGLSLIINRSQVRDLARLMRAAMVKS